MKIISKQNNSRMCVVCGLENDYGIKAPFYNMEDGSVMTIFKYKDIHQSYPNRVHALFNNNALDRFENNPDINEVVTTDTISHPEFANSKKIKVLSIAEMISDVIKSHESHEAIKDKYSRFH